MILSAIEYGQNCREKGLDLLEEGLSKYFSRTTPGAITEAWTSLWVIPFVAQRASHPSSPEFSGEPT